MISKNKGQFLLSGFILLATISFFAWCFKINHTASSLLNLTSYRAVLTSADGLKSGSNVFSKGVEIGKVQAVTLQKDQDSAKVIFAVKSQLKLAEDSVLTLSKSMTGDSHLDLVQGKSSHFLKAGEEIKNTFSQPSLEQKISNFAFGSSVQN